MTPIMRIVAALHQRAPGGLKDRQLDLEIGADRVRVHGYSREVNGLPPASLLLTQDGWPVLSIGLVTGEALVLAGVDAAECEEAIVRVLGEGTER